MARSFNRASFLSATTTLLEDVIPASLTPMLGLGDIPIRELTAAQRLEAVEVAKLYDADGEEVTLLDGTTKIDTVKYWAAIVTMSVLDPDTCFDADGNFQEGVGQLLLQPDDIFDLAERGKEALQPLANRIMNLSWIAKSAMFRLNQTADHRQPAADASDGSGDQGTDAQGVDARDDRAVLGA